jgi:hypothetical protein
MTEEHIVYLEVDGNTMMLICETCGWEVYYGNRRRASEVVGDFAAHMSQEYI